MRVFVGPLEVAGIGAFVLALGGRELNGRHGAYYPRDMRVQTQ